MIQQNYSLSTKIVTATENARPHFSRHLKFYRNYSLFALKALKKPSFQEFLSFILLSENIDEKIVNSVNINVFPAPRKNGFNIIGKCDTSKGKIRIYPKSFNYCSAFRKKYGKDFLFAFVGNRARAALIHELLHLKYISDEKKVEQVTDLYFSLYIKKRVIANSQLTSLNDLIFSSKKNSPFDRAETTVHS